MDSLPLTHFGPDALYVIDGTSRNSSLLTLRQAQGPWVFYSPASLNSMDRIVVRLIRSLSSSCDFIIKLDTDEFLTRIDYRLDGSPYFNPLATRRWFDQLPVTGSMYTLSSWAYSVPSPSQCGQDPAFMEKVYIASQNIVGGVSVLGTATEGRSGQRCSRHR